MNMQTLLETQMKIKASLAVLVGESEEILNKIQIQYLKNATLILDENDKAKWELKKSEYIKFLERDERDKILKMKSKKQL